MEKPDMAVEKEKDAATPALKAASEVPTAVLSDSDGEWVIKADTGATSSEEDSSDDELETQYDQRKNDNYNDKAEGSRDPGVLATAPLAPAVNLNQLKSQILRLKLQGKAEEATALQAQYDNAVESGGSSNIKVLDSVDIRQTQLLQSTHKAEPGDMTVADMVREEKLTAGNNRADREWANVLVASRASASGNAEDDNDELFDAASAGRGPRRTHASQKTDKDKALERTRAYNALADRCPLCVDSTAVAPGNKPLPISFATRAYLTPAPAPALVPHTMAIVPIEHEARNLTALDADDWEEIRNYMKCLIRYWSEVSRGRTSVVFYENAVFSQGESGARSHPALFAVPVPTDLLESSVIPGAFRAAFQSADEEWSTHRKVIDSSRVSGGFRATFAKEAPYFHVWFNINGGLGHIVEGDRWPRHDLFAREVLGGVLGTDIAVIKRRTRWTDTSDAEFEKSFLKYDWVDQVQQY